MSKTKFLLPVEPLFALGIIGVVFFGMQAGVAGYQKYQNYGKVFIRFIVAQEMEC
jgi:Na+/H+-dicarboxylate symporter